MADSSKIDKAIDAVIQLAAALGIQEKQLIDIIEEGIIFCNDKDEISDETIEIVQDLVDSPEFDWQK